MEIYALSGLINSIIAFSIGILVFVRNKTENANRTFSLFALSVAFWSLGYWLWLSANDKETALFWIKLFTVASTFVPLLYFLWIGFLLDLKGRKFFRYFLYSISALSFLTVVFLFTSNFLIEGTTQRLFFPFWPVPGKLYAINIAVYLFLVGYSLILLFRNLKTEADELKRKQYFFALIGSLIGFGGGATNFLLWYGIQIPPYGNFLVSIGLFLWGYAAAKYQLFNIRAVVAEVLTFAIWVAVFIDVLSSSTPKEYLFKGGLLIFVIILGVFLIKSVHNEVKQREELKITNEKLVQLNKLKSEFLSFASHQIKSPMTVVKGYASLIYDGTYGPVSDEVKGAAVNIKESADRLISLVGDFLDLRKIEEGQMEYHFEKINLSRIVGSMVEDFKLIAKKKNLDLTLEASSNDIQVMADEQKLRQVIQNLIDNAIKYTDKGFVKVELKERDGSVLLSVKDSGRGISKELLPNLFQQFARDASVKKIQGTGLGLYIAKEIIKAHKGEIWAESAGEGQGTSFCVKLSKNLKQNLF